MARPVIALAIALCLGACKQLDEPPVVATSRYVEYASDAFEPCPAFMDRLDGYVEAVYADLGREPPSGLLLRYNYTPDGLRGLCDEGAPGCACVTSACEWPTKRKMATVFSLRPAHYHEIAHAIAAEAGLWTERSFFDEGFAERYSSKDGDWAMVSSQQDIDIPAALAASSPVDYLDALVVAEAIVDQHGVELYTEFLSQLASTGGDAESLFESIAGQSLQALADSSFGSTYCSAPLAQCGGPELAWLDGTATFTLAGDSCGGGLGSPPAQLQSFAEADGYVEQRATVVIDGAGEYRLDKPAGADVFVVACDQPCDAFTSWQPLVGGAGTESVSALLNAGRYELVVVYRDEALDGASVSLVAI